MIYKAEELMKLNKERQDNAKIIRMKVLGMILAGYTKKEIEQKLRCSQSTINRSFQSLSREDLESKYHMHRNLFPGVSIHDITLFWKAGFLYSKYHELLKTRETAMPSYQAPEKKKRIRPKPKFGSRVQETSPISHEERKPEVSQPVTTRDLFGEMPRQLDDGVKEPFEERYRRVRREQRRELERQWFYRGITESSDEDSFSY